MKYYIEKLERIARLRENGMISNEEYEFATNELEHALQNFQDHVSKNNKREKTIEQEYSVVKAS